MNKGQVLINVPKALNINIIRDGLAEAGYGLLQVEKKPEEIEDLISAAQGCVAIIAGMEPWNEESISRVRSSVRMIIRYGAGYNTVNIDDATRLGMPIFNTAGQNASTVAEVALMHILNANRQFSLSIEQAKRGERVTNDMTVHELTGKTVGLLGAGNIAQYLVKMLQGFETPILAYDPYPSEKMRAMGVEFVPTPGELFARSDIVSIHVPLTEKTCGMVDEQLLRLLKPGAILVNTSRGPIIREQDLIRALREGWLHAAGLDVVVDEPVQPENPLLHLPNVYVTTHIGASAYEAKLRVESCLVTTIVDFFAGKYKNAPPFNLINPDYPQGNTSLPNPK